MHRICPILFAALLGAGPALQAVEYPDWVLHPQAETPEMSPRSQTLTIEALADETIGARVLAATELGRARVSSPQALEALSVLAADPTPQCRCAAVYALGRSGAAAAHPEVVKLLADPHATVRVAACEAVAELPPASQFSLNALPLADTEPTVRLAAVRAAVALPWTRATSERLAARFAQETDVEVQTAILEGFAESANAAPAAVIERALESPQPAPRAQALRLLRLTDVPALAPRLEAIWARALSDPAAAVRREAVRLACARGSATTSAPALQALAALADDRDHAVRRAFCQAVVAQPEWWETTWPLLEARQDDADRFVRRAATMTLIELTAVHDGDMSQAGVIDRALHLVDSQSPRLRREGIWILGRLRVAKAMPRILTLARTEFPPPPAAEAPLPDIGDLRESRLVAWAVARAKYEPAAELMLTYVLQAHDHALRYHGASALGEMRWEPAVAPLAKAVLEIEIVMGVPIFKYTGIGRTAVLEALGKIGTPTALKALAKISTMLEPVDTSPNLQTAAHALVQNNYTAVLPGFRKVVNNEEGASIRHRQTLAEAYNAMSDTPIPVPDAPHGRGGRRRFFLYATDDK